VPYTIPLDDILIKLKIFTSKAKGRLLYTRERE